MKKSKETNRRPDSSSEVLQPRKQRFGFKPDFLTYFAADSHTGIDFKRKWRLFVLFTTIMVLTPLCIMMVVDAKLSLKTLEIQTTQNMSQIVSICAESISQQLKGVQNNTSTAVVKNHLNRCLSLLKESHNLDIFLVDRHGRQLTDSLLFQDDDHTALTISNQLKETTGIIRSLKTAESGVVAVYTDIQKTGFTLILAKQNSDISALYFSPRMKLVGYLAGSILVIILSILGTTTYLVGRIHQADKRRVDALHHAESANKLAAIGRLASGVAHEINNPLAIINEKNGLLLDILSADEPLDSRQRLKTLANNVTGAVRRCGRITKRLLDFARHMEPSIERVSIEKIIRQILGFYEKEAERLNIQIELDFTESIDEFETDKGSLQQIFLNLIENAFDAMKVGGTLTITAHFKKDLLTVIIADTGIGISKEDRQRIFEPFYSSKDEMWKTGLGLSITYGLVKEINGDITVDSREGKGSQFMVTLPTKTEDKTVYND